ncbi:MAG: alkaline phytoceramidase [Planctomycetota bacterium]
MKKLIFLIFCAACVAAPFFVSRVAQPPEYHDFADRREWLGIANFGDVASNVPFMIVGILGISFLLKEKAKAKFKTDWERSLYIIFFIGVFFTVFGSSFYHLAPSNLRVMWDRFPIAVACGALTLILIAERVSLAASQWLTVPVLTYSIGSVAYWYFTETAGVGDLRFWGLAQFFPAVAIPVMFLLFPANYSKQYYYFAAIGCYAAAKLLEVWDRQTYEILRFVSGHSLKHLFAAFAAYLLLVMIQKRQIRQLS